MPDIREDLYRFTAFFNLSGQPLYTRLEEREPAGLSLGLLPVEIPYHPSFTRNGQVKIFNYDPLAILWEMDEVFAV